MKYFFYRLEIQDGGHGYYHRGVLEDKTKKSATRKADIEAKSWYDDSDVETTIESHGPVFYFPETQVSCWVDELREITKSHYEILKQYL